MAERIGNADVAMAVRDEAGNFRIIIGRGSKTEVIVISRPDAAAIYRDLDRKLTAPEKAGR